ncbi:MAG: FHA domain-containing protein [Actinomycetaceae bacterium]|nr:FHA domain-containing protein [Actinomycetaceae bacterium]
MSALVLTVLRLGFLALLWFFVFAVLFTLRRDVYGTRVRERKGATAEKKPRGRRIPTPSAPAPARNQQRSQPAASPAQPTVLTVTAGALAGTTLPLGNAQIVVGRSPDSALVLDDTYSSSRHARFYQSDGRWWVEDLESTNGTFVSGQRINTPTPIAQGTPVVIGRTTMELR